MSPELTARARAFLSIPHAWITCFTPALPRPALPRLVHWHRPIPSLIQSPRSFPLVSFPLVQPQEGSWAFKFAPRSCNSCQECPEGPFGQALANQVLRVIVGDAQTREEVCMLQRRLRTVCRHVKPLPGRYSEIFHSMHESLAEVVYIV